MELSMCVEIDGTEIDIDVEYDYEDHEGQTWDSPEIPGVVSWYRFETFEEQSIKVCKKIQQFLDSPAGIDEITRRHEEVFYAA